MTKDRLIPEIRFPEFKKEGEWDENRISELGETINGLTGKSGEDFGDGSPFVTYKQVFDKSIIDFAKCGKVQIGINENQNTLQKGDILFTTSSETPNEVGFASVLVNEPMEATYLNSFCFSLRPFDIEEIQPQFSRYLFHSSIYRKSVTTIAQGSTRYNISKGAFLNLKLPVPKPQEQQKIASCLSFLDEVISAHSQKLELLKVHKKGLMQNLFPQEGETVPKYRFKEFEDDEEWEINELNKLGDLINGLTYSPEDVRENGLLVLRSSNVQNGLIALNDCVYVRTDIQGANLSKPNDILVCVRNGSKNLIGKNAIIPIGLPLATHGAFMTVFRAKNPKFAFQLFQTDFYDKQVKADLGATINSINGKNFLKYEFPVPKNPKEQQKIASCLSSLDALITAQAEKIEQLKLHKKGLMQGLFPKIKD
jgi:type I restriction enzyme S subunit